MTCGIYSIKNITNKKQYIGSSNNCEHRFKQHQKELRHNYHANDHLQKSINKYGLENFEFTIIDECTRDDLIYVETLWINHLNTMDSTIGYNKRSPDNSIISQETKDKIKAFCNTPEHKKWLVKNAKENIWGDEEVKTRLLKNQWASMHTDAHKKLKSEQRQNAWDSSPEIKKIFSKNFKKKWDNEESPNRNKKFNDWRGSDKQKEIMSKRTKARWNDPKERKKMIAVRKEFGKDPKFKEKMSKISKEKWENPEFKQKLSNIHKTQWKDDAYRKMMNASRKKNLKNKTCIICKNIFTPNVCNQKCCSKKCKNAHRCIIRKKKIKTLFELRCS